MLAHFAAAWFVTGLKLLAQSRRRRSLRVLAAGLRHPLHPTASSLSNCCDALFLEETLPDSHTPNRAVQWRMNDSWPGSKYHLTRWSLQAFTRLALEPSLCFLPINQLFVGMLLVSFVGAFVGVFIGVVANFFPSIAILFGSSSIIFLGLISHLPSSWYHICCSAVSCFWTQSSRRCRSDLPIHRPTTRSFPTIPTSHVIRKPIIWQFRLVIIVRYHHKMLIIPGHLFQGPLARALHGPARIHTIGRLGLGNVIKYRVHQAPEHTSLVQLPVHRVFATIYQELLDL